MIYEFKCSCGHIWEDRQKMTATHVATCPKCGLKNVKSTITGGTGFAFVDKHWNPVKGFPDNDREVHKQAKTFEKEGE